MGRGWGSLLFLPLLLVEGKAAPVCSAWGRFAAAEGTGTRRRNAHPTPSRCPGGWTRDSLAVGDDDSFYYRWITVYRCLTASHPLPLLFMCCGRGWARTLRGFLPSCYLPVSVKNVGGLEDGRGTELASEPPLLRCSSLAEGCWQGVPGSPRHPRESQGSWRQNGGRLIKKKKKKKKKKPAARGPALRPELPSGPRTLAHLGNPRSSGKAAAGSWHSFLTSLTL